MGLFKKMIPTAKFTNVGDKVSGTIVRFEHQQRTEFDPSGKGTGELMFWVNGKPKAGIAFDPETKKPNQPVMDQVVVIDTDEADEYGETQRRLFVKGKQTLSAIKEACKKVGVQDVDEGGRLTCTWVDGAGRVGSPKVYTFEYVPPGEDVVAVSGSAPQATNPFA